MNFACLSKCRSSGSKRPSKVGFCGHCCGDTFSVGWMADDIRHVQSDETCPKVVALPTIDQNDSDLHPPDDSSIRRVATGFHTKIVLPPNWAFVSTLQLSRSHWTLLHLCRSRTHYGNFKLSVCCHFPEATIPAKIKTTRGFSISPLLICAVVTRGVPAIGGTYFATCLFRTISNDGEDDGEGPYFLRTRWGCQ